MIIIWGPRRSGRVGQTEGQYATTIFVQLYYILPIAPLRSVWVVDPHRDAGHETKLWWRSVVAGYVRSWGIVLGALLVGGGAAAASVAAIVGGLAGLAAAAWTFTWRGKTDERARVRADLNEAAFGTRCEAALFPPQIAWERRAYLEQRWAAISDGKSPNDIAEFGAAEPQRAVVAYGLLALAAATAPERERGAADADAWRIVDHVLAQPQRELGHPYRAQLADVAQLEKR